jgi:gamma-glutamyltranspeptidase / glutathione hydrolase
LALGFLLCVGACARDGAPEVPVVSPSSVSSLASAAPPATPPPKLVERYAVAAENLPAVEAARAAIEEGGSAVDGAIAGVLVGCAAHPSSCGIGGGGAALAFDARSKEVTALDFRETAPVGLKRTDHVGKPDVNKRGTRVGVPGLVAGLAALHARGGKLPWVRLFELAASMVERGLPVSPYMAQVIGWNAAWLATEPGLLGSERPAEGDPWKNAPLVATLRAIGEGGPKALYGGAVGTATIEAARARGSRISASDLTEYAAVVRPPVRVDYGDAQVFTLPPPSGGGVQVASVLGVLSPDSLGELPAASGAFVHVLAEGLRATYLDRGAAVGDPAFTRFDAPALFDPERMRARRRAIPMDATTMPKLPSVADSGTFHLVVADEEGNVVSLTASLTSMFGSKIVVGGFVLNDALSDFASDDYGQRAFTRGPNFPRGRARPVSNHVPVIVVRDGSVVLGAGASGGLRAVTGLAQVLVGHLGRRLPLQDAIVAPRAHVTAGGALRIETELAELAEDLRKRGEVVDVERATFAAVTGVSIERHGANRSFFPVFDPRKGGAITVEKRASAQGQEPAPTRGNREGRAP